MKVNIFKSFSFVAFRIINKELIIIRMDFSIICRMVLKYEDFEGYCIECGI